MFWAGPKCDKTRALAGHGFESGGSQDLRARAGEGLGGAILAWMGGCRKVGNLGGNCTWHRNSRNSGNYI